MTVLMPFANALGRVLIAAIFVMSGVSKIPGYAATQGFMESMGVPGALLPAVIVVEIVAGLAVIIGWRTRLAAFLLAGFTLLSAVLFHANFADQMQMILFMKNLAITGGLLFLVVNGGGALSMDNRQSAAST